MANTLKTLRCAMCGEPRDGRTWFEEKGPENSCFSYCKKCCGKPAGKARYCFEDTDVHKCPVRIKLGEATYYG